MSLQGRFRHFVCCRSSLCGVDDATEEENAAGTRVADEEQEGMVGAEYDRRRFDTHCRREHDGRRGRSCLGASFVHVDEGLVNRG
jgi:hypothetical protein